MKNTRQFYILALLLITTCTSFANAQTRNRKTHTRKPVVRQPARQPVPVINPRVLEPEVISRAEDSAAEDNAIEDNSIKSANSAEPNSPLGNKALGNKSNLTDRVDKLNNKLTSLESEQRSLVNLEKLTRAEERSELLRKQLNEALDKETALKAKIEQLDYSLRPEIIEREMAGFGSTRPEEARETRRKMLENEKTRSKEQLLQVSATRTRLETALTNADTLVEKLNAVVNNENKSDKAKEIDVAGDPNQGNSSNSSGSSESTPQ